MTEKLQQTIKEEISQLPIEGQEAIGSVDWLKIAEEIGKKYLLDESEIEDLQLETLLVLTGITDPEFFSINVENQVGTTKNEAGKIADEVFKQIFIPISNLTTENIKNSLNNKNPNSEQTLNFILSGGNYLTLVENLENAEKTPTETQNTNTSVSPRKITDLRSKFTI